ncbi:MAG: GTP cyclohydrolase I FolE [bacterium]|nr:GTP cyclohydrolase I FolE [bacterium]
MTEAMEEHIRELLAKMGEDPKRAGLLDTPARAAEALRALTVGYFMDLDQVVNGAIFEEKYDEMVICKGIEVYSLCEHHILPFYGQAHIAYVPDGRILGLSKLARVVDIFARRLQLQERLTHQVAEALDQVLSPKGVAVVIEAKHLCMLMRGVEKQNTIATTSCMLGVFKSRHETRMEFLNLIGRKDG